MKKLKYFLLCLCAIVMCACCFSFKTNEVEASSTHNKVSIFDIDETINDGVVGYNIKLELSENAFATLNSNYQLERSQNQYCELIVGYTRIPNVSNCIDFYDKDSSNQKAFNYFDSKNLTSFVSISSCCAICTEASISSVL